MKKTPKILLIDDHPLFGRPFAPLSTTRNRRLQICEAETLAGARAILAREPNFVIVLLDLKLPDCCRGFSGMLLSLQSEYPQIPVAVVSSSSEPRQRVSRAMAFGAAEFIPKSAKRADIDRALETMLSGELWAPDAMLADAIPELVEAIASLSPAQLRVLMGVQRGLRNKQIAFEIGIAEDGEGLYDGAVPQAWRQQPHPGPHCHPNASFGNRAQPVKASLRQGHAEHRPCQKLAQDQWFGRLADNFDIEAGGTLHHVLARVCCKQRKHFGTIQHRLD